VLQLPLDAEVARLSGRSTCPACKVFFQVATRPLHAKGIYDHCGSGVIQREDGKPESIRVRIHAYEESTRHVTEYSEFSGNIVQADSVGLCRVASTSSGV
jgi:adenylate kinase